MHAPLPPCAPRRAITLFCLAALTVLSLAGCARDRTADSAALERSSVATQLLGPIPDHGLPPWLDPQRHRAHLPYPLAVGNRWDYTIHTSTTITTDAGPQPPDSYDTQLQVLIVNSVTIEGRLYYLQSEFDPRVVGPGSGPLYYEHQDRTGLFERDPVVAVPAAAGGAPEAMAPLAARLLARIESMPAAKAHPDAYHRAALTIAQRMQWMLHPAQNGASPAFGPMPPFGEIAWLRYPLYVGASWIVRDSPRFSRRISARERLEVPAGASAAWRLIGLSELYGPNDRVNFWYGDQGLLRFQFHTEAIAVDNTGAILGTVSTDSDQVLTNVELHDPAPIRSYAAGEVADEP